MSVLKSELKQMVTHEVGVRVEDALESAKRELSVLEGRQSAFADGSKAAEALLAHVDKDVEEGAFDLAVAEHVKKYVVRCSHALTNLSQQAMNLRMAQTGMVRGLDNTVKLLKNMVEEEEKKKQVALQAAQASAAPAVTPPERPRPVSIKEQRLAEEAAANAPKKRRGRKSRAADA